MNQFEQRQERILSRDEIVNLIGKRAEGCTTLDERKDAAGVYYFEAKTPEVNSGEYTMYVYQRKGSFPEQAASETTVLEAVYYSGGMPIGGDTIAEMDSATGEWKDK